MAEIAHETDVRPPSSERISQEHWINTKARGKYELPKAFGKFTDSNTNPIDAGTAAPTRTNLPGGGWTPQIGG